MDFHLMIVDDEAPIRKGLSCFIDWSSINCIVDVTACDGVEAMEKLKEYSIDIIITDIKMPEADGIELARYTYENYPAIQIIILTGYADFHYAQTAIQYNVSDFLLKPTSKDELLQAVSRAQEKLLTSKTQNTMAEEEISFLKDQLLQELTDAALTESIKTRLSHYEIILEHYYIAAFQLQTDTDQLNTLREIIKNQTSNSYCYRYNHLILAIYFEPAVRLPDSILQSCRDILEFANSLYAMEVSVGISLHHTSCTEFSIAASEAIQALTFNFYSSGNIACYTSQDIPDAYILTAEDTLCLYELENSLNNWQFSEAALQKNAMFTRLTSHFAKSVDIKSICTQIYYICSRVLMKKSLSPPPPEYLNSIHHSSSILQLEELTDELLRYAENQLAYSGKQYSPMIENAVSYIHQNLTAALSLEGIAGYIHVNPSHLSRTFKKECGSSLTEYINHTRVEKAKELLSASATLTYEISEQTGFHDPAYFSSIFKKYTGLSPKEYRQQFLPSFSDKGNPPPL